jgi:hypothetical protein
VFLEERLPLLIVDRGTQHRQVLKCLIEVVREWTWVWVLWFRCGCLQQRMGIT